MAQRQPGNIPIVGSVAIATDPTSGTVMADSDAVGVEGNYEARIILSQSAAALYNVARRNAANDANIAPYPMALYGAAGQSSEYAILVHLKAGERFRVTMGANLTGNAQVLVQLEEMG